MHDESFYLENSLIDWDENRSKDMRRFFSFYSFDQFDHQDKSIDVFKSIKKDLFASAFVLKDNGQVLWVQFEMKGKRDIYEV